MWKHIKANSVEYALYPMLLIIAIACMIDFSITKHNYSGVVIANKLNQKQKNFEANVKGAGNQDNLLQFSFSKPQAANNYILFLLKEGKPIYWNFNSLNISADSLLAIPDQGLLTQGEITYSFIKKKSNDTIAVAMIPMWNDQNIFLDKELKVSNPIELDSDGNYKINLSNGKKAGINIGAEITNSFKPSLTIMVLYPIWWLVFFLVVNMVFVRLIKRRSPEIVGWISAIVFIIPFLIRYFIPAMPFHLSETAMFRPETLSSSSGFNIRSLADLAYVIVTFSILTANYYYFICPKYARKRVLTLGDQAYNVLFLILVLTMVVGIIYPYLMLLIKDSNISFEFNDLNRVNAVSFVSLMLMVLILLSGTLAMYIIHIHLRLITINVGLQILIITLFSIALSAIFTHHLNFESLVLAGIAVLGFLLAVYLPIPINNVEKSAGSMLKFSSFSWYIVLAATLTFAIFIINTNKEKVIRATFAKQIELKREFEAELHLDLLLQKLSLTLKDSILGGDTASQITKAKISSIAAGSFKKYEVKSIHIVNKNDLPQLPNNSILRTAISSSSTQTIFQFSPSFQYQIVTPIWEKNGYYNLLAVISLIPKPDYLVSIKEKYVEFNPFISGYSYGIYLNNILRYHHGAASLLLELPTRQKSGSFTENIFSSTYVQKNGALQTVVVVHDRNQLLILSSLFSYVMIFLFIISCFYFFFKTILTNNLRALRIVRLRTLRAKIYGMAILCVLLSGLIFGVVSVGYINSRLSKDQKKEQNMIIAFLGIQLQQFMLTSSPSLGKSDLQSMIQNLKPTLSTLYNSEISLYDSSGISVLPNTFPRLMNPDILVRAAKYPTSTPALYKIFQGEDIQSQYLEVYNGNTTSGYLRVAYPEDKILVGNNTRLFTLLINLFVMLYIITGALSIFMANSFTRGLALLVRQFQRMQLKHNTKLEYQGNDEIKILVNEYNQMIVEVEQMASAMANNERETAWREVAMQVAHDITNPITPIKLQLQFLERASEKNIPNLDELLRRSITVILEQINTLEILAKQFSTYAKLPQPKPEVIDINHFIQNILQLYDVQQGLEVVTVLCNERAEVLIDRTYLTRSCTNLLKNAVQAVGDKLNGKIEIELTKHDGKVIITVSDNGVGMDGELLSKIFVPNFTTKSSGSGIGLSMTKSMIEGSGGSISATSELGEGSSFKVVLQEYNKDASES